MIEMHVDAVLFRGGLQHAKAFRDHFLADAVAGNDRDSIFLFLCSPGKSLAACGIGAWSELSDCNGPK